MKPRTTPSSRDFLGDEIWQKRDPICQTCTQTLPLSLLFITFYYFGFAHVQPLWEEMEKIVSADKMWNRSWYVRKSRNLRNSVSCGNHRWSHKTNYRYEYSLKSRNAHKVVDMIDQRRTSVRNTSIARDSRQIRIAVSDLVSTSNLRDVYAWNDFKQPINNSLETTEITHRMTFALAITKRRANYTTWKENGVSVRVN